MTAEEDDVVFLYGRICHIYRVRNMIDLAHHKLPHPRDWTEDQRKYMLGVESSADTLRDLLNRLDRDSAGPPRPEFWDDHDRWASHTRASSTHSRHSDRSRTGGSRRPQGRQQNAQSDTNPEATFTLKYDCQLVWKVDLPVPFNGNELPQGSRKRSHYPDEWPWLYWSEKRQRMQVSDQSLAGLDQTKATDQLRTNLRQLLYPKARAALLECVAYSCFADVMQWLQSYLPEAKVSKTGEKPATTIGPWKVSQICDERATVFGPWLAAPCPAVTGEEPGPITWET